MRTRKTSSPIGGFRARSRNTPRSRQDNGSRHEPASIVIVGSQVSATRCTFLLGRIGSRTQSTPADVTIVHLE